jgi:hypothetical protein
MGRTAWITLDTKTAGYTTWPAMAADAPSVSARPTVERKLARLLPRRHRGRRGLPTSSDVRPERLGQLHPERPHAARRPDDQDLLPRLDLSFIRRPWGGEPEDGDGRSLLEAEVGRLVAKWSSPAHGYSA